MMHKTDGHISEISKDQAKELIVKYHYLGKKGFRFEKGYGLFVNDELVGAAVYHGLSAPETAVGAFGLQRNQQDGIYELGRLVMKPEYNGGNWTSFLLGRSLRLIKQAKARAIITYASSDIHGGGIYRACNFVFYGLTTQKKDFWVNGKIQERGKTKGIDGIWKDRPRKYRFALVFDNKLPIKWQPKLST